MPILAVTVTGSTGGSAGTGPFINVFHVSVLTADVSTGNLIITRLKKFYDAIAVIYPSGSTRTVGSRIVEVAGAVPALVPSPPVNTVAGTGTAIAPPQICYVTSWRTLVATKHGRGRTYLGPLANSVLQTDGRLFTTLVSTIQTAANTLISDLNTDFVGNGLVIYNRATKGGIPVASALVSSNPYTQRRRAM